MKKKGTALNCICPYFTMFPLDFPLSILQRYASRGEWIVDPFCGRGTTNYAGRVLGLPSFGVDSSPVAVAISQAKLANASSEEILNAAKEIFSSIKKPKDIPYGEFWKRAYNSQVLEDLCRLREGLSHSHLSNAQKALRGIVLGGLHGPRKKKGSSYFSNQAQRTYAPKPAYAVRYWKKNRLNPEYLDVLQIIRERADRYYLGQNSGKGKVVKGDSRHKYAFSAIEAKAKWVITSPPYYGMRTYLPDQWLRAWFLGGPSYVCYSADKQVSHSSPEVFAKDLRQVWINVGEICAVNANLVIRFGGINKRSADPLLIIKDSLHDTGWRIKTIHSAGSADEGYRQAKHINKSLKKSREEFDIWARWEG
jgi:DNA modification methylase